MAKKKVKKKVNNKLTEPFDTWYDELYSIRAEILKEKEQTEVVPELLDDWSDEIENIALQFIAQSERHEELIEKENELESVRDEIFPEQFDNLKGKGEVLRDLARNCTIEELEALEMLMRIKKGSNYRERNAVIHPDHVNLGLCFGGKKHISVNDYFLL